MLTTTESGRHHFQHCFRYERQRDGSGAGGGTALLRFVIAMIVTLALAVVAGNIAYANTSPCDVVKPIRFRPGNNGTTVSGGVARGEVICWSLAARPGQSAKLSIGSAENNAVFQFYQPGWKIVRDADEMTVSGTAYKNATEGDDATHWSGKLAGSGPQLIVVGSQRGGAAYILQVRVSP